MRALAVPDAEAGVVAAVKRHPSRRRRKYPDSGCWVKIVGRRCLVVFGECLDGPELGPLDLPSPDHTGLIASYADGHPSLIRTLCCCCDSWLSCRSDPSSTPRLSLGVLQDSCSLASVPQCRSTAKAVLRLLSEHPLCVVAPSPLRVLTIAVVALVTWHTPLFSEKPDFPSPGIASGDHQVYSVPKSLLNDVRTSNTVKYHALSLYPMLWRNSSENMRRQALLLAILGVPALASVPEWGQCGGTGWTGETDCAAGLACVEQNEWYSQCLPGTATTTTSPTTVSTTSTVKSTTTVSTTTTVKSTTTTSSAPSSTGFIKTSGTRFTLNGQQFVPVGSNAYWPALLGYTNAQIDQAFADIAASGATVCRTEGFNEVTSANGVYFQLWSGKTATVNTGTNGLQRLDYLVSSAKAHGIKLLITLTNNWSDFGGMDVYTTQLLGSGLPHDTFYTNPTVVAAFKTYVKAIVTRYSTENTIMAWELANEPRCAGTSTLDPGLPLQLATAQSSQTGLHRSPHTSSPSTRTISSRSVMKDSSTTPSPHNYDYPYQGGGIGIDFAANLALSTLDFGTFHMYPDSWGESGNDIAWGQQWITDHAAIMTSANKPVIMEEFGLTYTGTQRSNDYATWYNTVLTTGLTGDLLWQAGSTFNGTQTPNDGYAIYPGDPVYTLLGQHAAAMKARG
ncbi:Glycoside hydrolase family 5 protein [Mycena sanguinolenta]|uniref:mannan endo-1,4-beta-mannosidase n=1 Tax=Mycena sanguinolenta TaxID=230812 RepID=A0A8H6ZIG2_9AGAR|nr:Glycoside hydrolase family 5 protein [Mycena sanguinolenta]